MGLEPTPFIDNFICLSYLSSAPIAHILNSTLKIQKMFNRNALLSIDNSWITCGCSGGCSDG